MMVDLSVTCRFLQVAKEYMTLFRSDLACPIEEKG